MKLEAMKLSIELVPQTAFFRNVRSEVSKAEWDVLRRQAYKKYNYRCAICNGIGDKHPVECHEVWDYNDEKYIQTLKELTALCPKCHQVKHIGLSQMRGLMKDCIEHIMLVNEMTRTDTKRFIYDAFKVWENRSHHAWNCDISIIQKKETK